MIKEKQTYGNAIDGLKRESNRIYEECGGLRDRATGDEKQYYNRLRGLLGEVWNTFVALEDSMSQARYDSKL
jgi:hypothetical protein